MKLPTILPQPPDSDAAKLVKRVLGESLRPHWRSYALGFFFLAIMSGTTAGTAWLMRDVVNEVFVAKNETMLWVISAAVILLFALRGFATYMQSTILARVGNRIVAQNQQRIYDHCVSLHLDFFAKTHSSHLIHGIFNGAVAARQVVDLVVQSIGRDFLTLVGLTFVMVVQAPLMSLLAIVTGPFAVAGVIYLAKRIRDIAKLELLSATRIISVLQETAHGARIIKAFGLDAEMRERMAQAVAGVETRANKIANLQARTAPLMETLSGLAIGVVIAVAGWQTIHHSQTPGAFMSFITALLLAYEPAKRLARLHVTLHANLVGVRMMFSILDTKVGVTEATDAPDLAVSAGRIEFRDVTFAYREGKPVLSQVNFVVEGGEKVALVGASGAGKTTILNLVQRFYDVQDGAVLIDGQDVRSVSSRSLRAAISLVSQDTYLFSGTIRENIGLGRPGATSEEIEKAARDAHADEFIRELPKGYDTDVGENGVQLSGGQRQRIAIARALLKDTPIILLDEATSALDSETERKIQAAVALLTKGRTTIVIAHRLSTVMDADRILVVQSDTIVEQGTHGELLRRGGVYERLYRIQFADLDDRIAMTAN